MGKIHSTAIVHPDAVVHETVQIGPWCTVGPKVEIGAHCELISHVVIEGRTRIGQSNKIFPFSVLGAVPQDLKYKGEDTTLEIGSFNTIRESVTINLGTAGGGGSTILGSHNLLMAYVHVGHDSRIGDHNVLANAVGLAGHVIVGNYVVIGGMSGVGQFIRIGDHAYLGGQCGVEKDVPPFAIGVGTRPLELKGANIVGLRRRGFPAERISRIHEAIKLWMRPDIPKEQVLLEIDSQYGEFEEIQQFLKFIRETSFGVAR